MTSKDRDLLLKDICARLPYGFKYRHRGAIFDRIQEITPEGFFVSDEYNGWFDISTCKPYLRPLSDMTEEEYAVLRNIERNYLGIAPLENISDWMPECAITVPEYLNSRHFDYRGLIPKGLALRARKGMY